MIDFLMLDYLSYATLREFNSSLLTMLGNPAERQICISKWDGTLDHLPNSWPVFVHASPQIECSRADLARACGQCGHVPFYDDALVCLDGELSVGLLRPAVTSFLAHHQRRDRAQKRRQPKNG